MGTACCMDRDKPPPESNPPSNLPAPDPSAGFLTKKPKEVLKLILMIASDTAVLPRMLSMLQQDYQMETHEKGVYLIVEEWKFDIRTASGADVGKIVSDANQAKVVFFFFDLKDPRGLSSAYDQASTFKTATRKDSLKYLVGYNSAISDSASQEAGEAAADLGLMYLEIPFPRPSSHQLVERMKK